MVLCTVYCRTSCVNMLVLDLLLALTLEAVPLMLDLF